MPQQPYYSGYYPYGYYNYPRYAKPSKTATGLREAGAAMSGIASMIQQRRQMALEKKMAEDKKLMESYTQMLQNPELYTNEQVQTAHSDLAGRGYKIPEPVYPMLDAARKFAQRRLEFDTNALNRQAQLEQTKADRAAFEFGREQKGLPPVPVAPPAPSAAGTAGNAGTTGYSASDLRVYNAIRDRADQLLEQAGILQVSDAAPGQIEALFRQAEREVVAQLRKIKGEPVTKQSARQRRALLDLYMQGASAPAAAPSGKELADEIFGAGP